MRLNNRMMTVPVLALAVLLVTSACGGGSSGGNNAKVTTNSGSNQSNSSAQGAAVTTHSGPNGVYLTDASGRTLYLWKADTSTSSNCNGTCAGSWPPFTTSGSPSASGKATQSMLGTTKRNDGSMQVTYNGHPLYYYAGDSAPGDMNGQGSNQYGALWWMVTPTGNAITAKGSGAGSPSPASTGGGWS
jgi:predicted lipoprotein with Yx(FWY)xxD motif